MAWASGDAWRCIGHTGGPCAHVRWMAGWSGRRSTYHGLGTVHAAHHLATGNLRGPRERTPHLGSTGLLIYLLFLVGLLDLHTRVCGHGGRLERLGFQLARVGLVMNVGGNIADYWLGRETLGQGLWGAGFTIGTMLGTLVYTIGAVLLGSAILRTGALPRWTGVVLILAPLLGVSMLFWGVRYIPANFILGNSIGWVVIGYILQSDKGSEAPLLGAS